MKWLLVVLFPLSIVMCLAYRLTEAVKMLYLNMRSDLADEWQSLKEIINEDD